MYISQFINVGDGIQGLIECLGFDIGYESDELIEVIEMAQSVIDRERANLLDMDLFDIGPFCNEL